MGTLAFGYTRSESKKFLLVLPVTLDAESGRLESDFCSFPQNVFIFPRYVLRVGAFDPAEYPYGGHLDAILDPGHRNLAIVFGDKWL